MKTKKLLAKAIRIAVDAHHGQFDKGGMPYVLHPIRIALKFDDEISQVVAVLHDVIEDSLMYQLEYFKVAEFPKKVTDALIALTKRPGENYTDYIRRVGENELATRIKVQDLMDNMNLARLNRKITRKDNERNIKYNEAYHYLIDKQIGEGWL